MLQACVRKLLKNTAVSHFLANQKSSWKGSLRVNLPERAVSLWGIQRRKCRMEADKVLVVLMTTEMAIKGFVFSMTKIRTRAVIETCDVRQSVSYSC